MRKAVVIDLKWKHHRFIGLQMLNRQHIDTVGGPAGSHVNTSHAVITWSMLPWYHWEFRNSKCSLCNLTVRSTNIFKWCNPASTPHRKYEKAKLHVSCLQQKIFWSADHSDSKNSSVTEPTHPFFLLTFQLFHSLSHKYLPMPPVSCIFHFSIFHRGLKIRLFLCLPVIFEFHLSSKEPEKLFSYISDLWFKPTSMQLFFELQPTLKLFAPFWSIHSN